MEQLIRIGLDTSKRFFQLHGVDAAERPVLRRQLRRSEVIGFFSRPAPTLVAWRLAAPRIIGRVSFGRSGTMRG